MMNEINQENNSVNIIINSEEDDNNTEDSQICIYCISPVEFGSKTNCNHIYCTACIVSHLNHNKKEKKNNILNCPICNNLITQLTLLTDINKNKYIALINIIEKYNKYNNDNNNNVYKCVEFINNIFKYIEKCPILWIALLIYLIIFVYEFFFYLTKKKEF